MARTYKLNKPQAATPSGRRIDYAAELNAQQCEAVTAGPGPMLVIAGAGSGKTRTLTYRVAYLLENGVEPSNILLLTFTNKAAREMLDRVSQLLPDSTDGLWGGTFHSIGNKILRRHAEALGFRRGFSIMDREDQEDLMKTVVAAAGIDPKEKRFPKPEVVADIFSMAVNTHRNIGHVVNTKYPYFLDQVGPAPERPRPLRGQEEVHERDGFRRSAGQDPDPAARARGGGLHLPAAVPVRHGGRIPGHQPHPGPSSWTCSPPSTRT